MKSEAGASILDQDFGEFYKSLIRYFFTYCFYNEQSNPVKAAPLSYPGR